ncbi:bacterioferritin comigratory protein [Vibrio parahaemolyticus]
MTKARDLKFQRTKKALFDALERLKEGKPSSLKLKIKLQKGKLKINRRTVEEEAGLSSGVLRNHDDVVRAIKQSANQQIAAKKELPSLSEVNAEVNAAMKARLKKQTELKEEYYDETKRLTDAMDTQLTAQHELVTALFNKIPLEEHDKLFRSKVVSLIKEE